MKAFNPTHEHPHRFCRQAHVYLAVVSVVVVLELCCFAPAMLVLVAAGWVLGVVRSRPLFHGAGRRKNRPLIPVVSDGNGDDGIDITVIKVMVGVDPRWAVLSGCLDVVSCVGLTITACALGAASTAVSQSLGYGVGHVPVIRLIAAAIIGGVWAWLQDYSHDRCTTWSASLDRLLAREVARARRRQR